MGFNSGFKGLMYKTGKSHCEICIWTCDTAYGRKGTGLGL